MTLLYLGGKPYTNIARKVMNSLQQNGGISKKTQPMDIPDRERHDFLLEDHCEGMSVFLKIKTVVRTDRVAGAIVELVDSQGKPLLDLAGTRAHAEEKLAAANTKSQKSACRANLAETLLADLVDDNTACFPHVTLALGACVPPSECGQVLKAYWGHLQSGEALDLATLPHSQSIVDVWHLDQEAIFLKGSVVPCY